MKTEKIFEMYDVVYDKFINCHLAIMSLVVEEKIENHNKVKRVWTFSAEASEYYADVDNLKLVCSTIKNHDEAIATIRALDKLKNCEPNPQLGLNTSTVASVQFQSLPLGSFSGGGGSNNKTSGKPNQVSSGFSWKQFIRKKYRKP